MIDGLPVLDWTPEALLALVVILLLTGRLVTLRELRDAQKDRDHWRQAAEERSSQLSELLTATHTSTAALQSIVQAAQESP